jgi:hypothetical protein
MRASNSLEKNNGHIPTSEAEDRRAITEISEERDAAQRAILKQLGL